MPDPFGDNLRKWQALSIQMRKQRDNEEYRNVANYIRAEELKARLRGLDTSEQREERLGGQFDFLQKRVADDQALRQRKQALAEAKVNWGGEEALEEERRKDLSGLQEKLSAVEATPGSRSGGFLGSGYGLGSTYERQPEIDALTKRLKEMEASQAIPLSQESIIARDLQLRDKALGAPSQEQQAPDPLDEFRRLLNQESTYQPPGDYDFTNIAPDAGADMDTDPSLLEAEMWLRQNPNHPKAAGVMEEIRRRRGYGVRSGQIPVRAR